MATAIRLRSLGSHGTAWWALAALALLPSVIPLVVLVVAGTGGSLGSIPTERLVELGLNTLSLAVVVTVCAVTIGTTTAWITTATDLPERGLWSTLVAIPLVLPSFVVAAALLGATGTNGVLSAALGFVVPSPTGFVGSALALSIFAVPYVHLTLVPAIRRIDPALLEAARGLGVTGVGTITRVLVPLLRPGIRGSALLVALYTISDFGAVSLLRFDTFTRAIYAQYQGRLDRGPALSLALILMLAALALVWLQRRKPGHVASTRNTRPLEPRHLRTPARVVARALLAVLGLVSLGLPALVLGVWLARGIAAGQEVTGLLAETARSLGVSLAAAALAALAAIPVSVVLVRSKARYLRPLANATLWGTHALPHIAIGLAIVVFALTWARPLYQTVTLLVLGYVAMFLPQTVSAVEDSLRRIPASFEEASRSLGRSPFATTARVTLPLVTRGLVAGGALVFMTTMKELPATLLLRPNGFETLAVRVWAAAGEGLYTRAAAASLVLVAVSTIPLVLVTLRELHD